MAAPEPGRMVANVPEHAARSFDRSTRVAGSGFHIVKEE
jgi:hypothetical protein